MWRWFGIGAIVVGGLEVVVVVEVEESEEDDVAKVLN